MVTHSNDMQIEIREHMRGGNESVELTKLCAELPEHMRLFSRIRLVKGASIGYHIHENESELFAFVSGTGRVTDDGSTYDVKAGDSMLTSSGHGHAVENTGDEDLVMIAVIVKD